MIKNDKKVVFIGHPVSGNVQENIKKILDICKKVHDKNIMPCVPYLVSLQYLNDEIVEDRELGIEANLECFHRKFIDELWLFGNCISRGMGQEINLALGLGIPVIPKTEGTKENLKILIEK